MTSETDRPGWSASPGYWRARLADIEAEPSDERPAGMDDQDVLLEAAAIIRRIFNDPSHPLGEELTALAFEDRTP